jgi:hypothetical protein
MKRIIAATAILFLAFAAAAGTTNGLSAAEIQGRQLAAEILSETPATNFTQTGVLRIRNSKGTTNIPITSKTEIGQGDWRVTYSATMGQETDDLVIVHKDGQPNEYPDSSDKTMTPFAGSDFWVADLGLEFFHWPEQKITGHETRKTRACTVLESDNPDPAPGAYSRVVTWIDNETFGIIHAEAYDANNKLLKVFDPKSLKKVNGHWELEDIEIRNVQTHSRTSIRFDLKGNS